MVFRSYELKKNLLRKEVSRETKQAYLDGVRELEAQWWVIKAIVCDGKRGMLWGFWKIATQMCIFHQHQIIRRYITKRPRLEANIELKEILECIGNFRKRNVELLLADWYRRYKTFLWEKNDSNNLIHTRTRKAYKSMKTNLKYLYTFKDYKWEIEIPRTTNSLESIFGHMKQKLWLHRWLKKWRKLKLIDVFLWK